jgi:hypothetical protein
LANAKVFKCLPQFKGFFQKARYKAALGGRGRGASTAMAQALVYFGSRYKMKIVCARQYMASIADSSKAQIEEIIYENQLESEWEILEKSLTHKLTKTEILFKGLDRSLLSLKSIPNIDVLAIEEAETISQKALDVLIPTIRKKGSEIWVVGNNRMESDPVSRMFLGAIPPDDLLLMRATYLENPHCTADFLADAELLRRKDEEMYRHVYLGEFINRASMRLVKRQRIDDGSVVTKPSDWIVFGVDIAGDGGDKTVISVRKGLKILEMTPFATMDLDTLILELNQRIAKYRPHRINIDSTGWGALAPQALRREGIIVTGVNFAESSDNPAYANRRTEIYALVGEFFDNGGCVPNDQELSQELEQSIYTLNKSNKFQMIPKAEIKDIIGRSPDKADSIALTMLTSTKDNITAPNQRAKKLESTLAMRELMDSCDLS